ncbi:MAG: hypothetical protein US11_C0006G0038 [Candidatus Roizmanbacteria bacterium GW2011_GWA2_36_23]|uniref:Abasic site processing protein n=1 Tax=Candidatus Roizmanbacteria bacterium GW2011_GWA2_36_23 TaxID=1618480 RepID=A0A0G0HCH4_9BACT|nr:MAG: hypothetical protein US11_C0006G0038 [Candidatus Roizmanbacteria bacterium GW2011_GWA2_36_23]
MCGRYNLELTERFSKRFQVNEVPSMKSRYNIAPSQQLPVIVKHKVRDLKIMKWGLVPFWSKDGKQQLINIRADSAISKPMFTRLIKARRCLVPATGFYEWKRTSDGKIPFLVRLKSQDYFSFAGLYDILKTPEGKEIPAYAIITTEPNDLMSKIHNRMPVILKKQDENNWLNPDNAEIDSLKSLLNPFQAELMEAYPISSRINNPFNDDKELLKEETN